MPRVGNKQFPYTIQGQEMAEREAIMTGLPVEGENAFIDRLLQEETMTRNRRINDRKTPRTNNRMSRKTTNRTPSKRMRY